jgi:hypothetical protein
MKARHLIILTLTFFLVQIGRGSESQVGATSKNWADAQTVYGCKDKARAEIWACRKDGKLFSLTANADSWTPVDSFMADVKVAGVDAVEIGGAEYILAASADRGIFYGFKQGSSVVWQRPYEPLPSLWMHTNVPDAAFFWPPPSEIFNPTIRPPRSRYYVVRANGGIYCWVRMMSNFNLLPSTQNILLQKFYRDQTNPNILYITSSDGLYKLSGPYGNETFEKLPPGTKLKDLPIAFPPKNLPPIK